MSCEQCAEWGRTVTPEECPSPVSCWQCGRPTWPNLGVNLPAGAAVVVSCVSAAAMVAQAANQAIKAWNPKPSPLLPLTSAFNRDPDYAHSWYANLVCAAMDAGADYEVAKKGASIFMARAFDFQISDDWAHRNSGPNLMLAEQIVQALNRMAAKDPQAFNALIEQRVPCNQALLADEACQVVGTPQGGGPMVGLLGVLNGIAGAYIDGPLAGAGPIAAVYDDDAGTLFRNFRVNYPSACSGAESTSQGGDHERDTTIDNP